VSINLFAGYYKKFCKKKKKSTEIDYIHAEAINKIYKQFSVENVIKRIREVKIISSLTMNKYQRTLLPFIHRNLIFTKVERKNNKAWVKAIVDYN